MKSNNNYYYARYRQGGSGNYKPPVNPPFKASSVNPVPIGGYKPPTNPVPNFVPNMKPPVMNPVKTPHNISPKNLPPPPASEDLKQTVCENSFLGNKGYTIPRTHLTENEIKLLCKETTITPKMSGPSFGPPGTVKDSPPCVYYKKDEKHIYLPRAYGIARYGLPYENRLSFGRDVREALTFASDKPLRDYQNEIINVYLEHIRKQFLDFEVFEEGVIENIPETPKVPDLLNPNQTHLLPPKNPEPKMERIEYGGGGILEVPCGRGKCLGKDTPVLMYDGTIKMVQDVVVGDLLMGDDSTPRTVLSLARGREMMYRVSSKHGNEYVVNKSHILSLKRGPYLEKSMEMAEIVDISVEEYLKSSYDPYLQYPFQKIEDRLYGYRVPISFNNKPQEIDPYLFGRWLGNNSMDVIEAEHYLSSCIQTSIGYYANSYVDSYYQNSVTNFKNFLKKYNLSNNKYLPEHYKCNSILKQLELLAGILDSESYFYDNSYEIIQKQLNIENHLLDDIMFLCRSLGFDVYKSKYESNCFEYSGVYYTLTISGMGIDEIPVRRPHKKYIPQPSSSILEKDPLKYEISITPIGDDDYYGFEIDGNRRFVLGDFTVTHNTVMALKIISEIGRPAMIFVNKGFLADQWLERIATYLPKASVGRIQADIFDVEGRDIVICMIQTVYDRDYTHDPAFRQFGITIIDECHRIGSGQFSKAMFNITTPYILGISATVDRKDGMEKALNLFIGDVLYSDKRQDGDCVQIRSVEYSDPADEEYNKEEHDYRGNVKYATMMSKICEHRPRLDFLYRILVDLVEEYPEDISDEFGCSPISSSSEKKTEKEKRGGTAECMVCQHQVAIEEFVKTSCGHSFCENCLDDLETPKCPLCKKRFSIKYSDSENISATEGGKPNKAPQQNLTEYPGQNQIIVLAQYRSVLKELYKRIQATGLTTVGYYVGGMKQEELDISKTKQILLATYSMASEGLDVATLSTLVFATPRTDIKQSVGRILRQKHERNPIVVDVVDSHKTFKNQWSKRRVYYKQNSYVIYQISCSKYTGMKNVEKSWKCIYSPKKDASGKIEKEELKKGDDSDEDDSEAIRKMAFDGVCML